MTASYPVLGITEHTLSDGLTFLSAQAPEELAWNPATFQAAWNLHPLERHCILIHGHPVQTPRWQQAYNVDYHYTGRTNQALPTPDILQPLLDWSRSNVDARLNGILLNWYEGTLGDYIGAHHDSVRKMVAGAPIVTISFGDARTFRLTRGKRAEREVRDFPAEHGTVFVMPWQTNLAWKHEVPHFARNRGRRISITLRAFVGGTAADLGDEPKPAQFPEKNPFNPSALPLPNLNRRNS